MSLRAIWAHDTKAKDLVPPLRGTRAEPRGFVFECDDVDPRIVATWKQNSIPSIWLFEDGWCRSVVYFHPGKELIVGIPGPDGKKYLEKVLGVE